MADIHDRLERLQRRDELARRVLQQRMVPEPVTGAGDDFVEVVEAVMQVVRRHPGMAVMVAPGDGRQGSAVVRVSEQDGDVDVSVVRASGG
jgi:hypothetical protein